MGDDFSTREESVKRGLKGKINYGYQFNHFPEFFYH
jgi:hypothetical protein